MSELPGAEESAQRMMLAAQAYAAWTEESLLDEFCLCTDEMASEDEAVAEDARSKREALGLALIARGWTAPRLLHYPLLEQ